MATLHNRLCKAEFYTDPDLLQLPRDVRMFYRDLWHAAEDSGCVEDSPFGWKILLYPSPLDADITPETITGWRDQLIAAGKLTPYQADGRSYIFLTNFLTHQRLTNPGRSEVPTPPWVTLEEHETDKRKRSYKVTSTVGQSLNNATATVEQEFPPRARGRRTEPNLTEEKRREFSLSDSAESNGAKRRKTAPPKVKAAAEDDWRDRADAILGETAFPSDYRQLAELKAARNKTGEMALSRIVRELYEPLLRVEREVSREAMRAGLRAAITKSAPNHTYVKEAAASYTARSAAVAPTSRTMDRSAFGEDFYTDGGEP